MKSTLGLLRVALVGRTTNEVAALLGVGATTVTMWKKAGRVSPEGAAKLAALLQEPVAEWVAIAAAEAMPEPKRSWLMRQLLALFTLGVVGLVMLMTPVSAVANDLSTQYKLCAVVLFAIGAARAFIGASPVRDTGFSAWSSKPPLDQAEKAYRPGPYRTAPSGSAPCASLDGVREAGTAGSVEGWALGHAGRAAFAYSTTGRRSKAPAASSRRQ